MDSSSACKHCCCHILLCKEHYCMRAVAMSALHAFSRVDTSHRMHNLPWAEGLFESALLTCCPTVFGSSYACCNQASVLSEPENCLQAVCVCV